MVTQWSWVQFPAGSLSGNNSRPVTQHYDGESWEVNRQLHDTLAPYLWCSFGWCL